MAASSAASSAPQTGFAAWQSAMTSYRLLFANLGDFLRIAWVWMAIAYLIGYAGSYLTVHTGESFLTVLGAIAVTLCAAAVAVKWHRRVLLGAAAVGPALALARRDFVFIGRAVLLLLLTIIPLSILMMLAVFAMFSDDEAMIVAMIIVCIVAFLLAMYVLARFCLILPAAAIDNHAFGWRASWRATASVSLRLWGGSFVVAVPLAVLSKLIENVAIFTIYQFGMLPLAIAFGIVSTILVFLTVALAATYTSLAYRALIRAAPG
jgi:hypothetical protein